MKVLVVHNHYKLAGGEDIVFANETALLRRNGHTVIEFTLHNDVMDTMGKGAAALNTIWSRRSYAQLKAVIDAEKPDIAHFHNWFMAISPSGYYACRDSGVPVVQTLHNYRLMCPAAIFYRDGHICEECLGKFAPLPAIQHNCYRDSKSASAVVAGMLTFHKLRGTWSRMVDRYIVLTEFARQKFIEGGFNADQLTVKPNFLVNDPGQSHTRADYYVFMGRWTQEKGVLTVLEAWRQLGDQAPPLKLLGEGPLDETVRALAVQNPRIEIIGKRTHAGAVAILQNAVAMIQPSEWYEGMPMTIVESLACGVPVIASNVGASGALIEHGRNGLHFAPGDANSLAQAIQHMQACDVEAMSLQARTDFETHYTAEVNYRMMMEIYNHVLDTTPARKA